MSLGANRIKALALIVLGSLLTQTCATFGVIFLLTAASGQRSEPARAAINRSDQQEPGAVTVQIVPSWFLRERRALMPQNFNVIVTNGTKEAIRLWDQSCPWGQNLSFEVLDSYGRFSRIAATPRRWQYHFPFWTTIPPGEHFVIYVELDDRAWKATPGPLPALQQIVRLRAIFEIRPDGETKKEGIWTGKASSDAREYMLE